MFGQFSIHRDLKTLLTILWGVFLCYGPVALFVMARFGYSILAENYALGAYLVYPSAVGGVCALITAVVYLFRAPQKMALPLFVFLLDFSLLFSPLQDIVEEKGFADFIKPEAAYVQKHCAPIDFVQDGKIHSFGVCDRIMDSSGQMAGFGFIYDT